eukprot:Skav211475  [mRNA]  locus=scaffold1118:102962:121514:- [translate_table: standard]
MDAGAAKYLEENVGGILATALAEMARVQPKDNCGGFARVFEPMQTDSHRHMKKSFWKPPRRRLRGHQKLGRSFRWKVSLPTVNVYNVEFAELPTEWGGLASPAPLPASIPMDKIMSNIEPELKLRHLADFFFRCYADAVAQAVLYAMFLAYPKSRIDFTEKSAWMGQWNRRPRRKLQYSPLVENFLRARKYSSVNLVRATSCLVEPKPEPGMHMTTAEQRAKKMDVKHAMLAERAKQARDRCELLAKEYATCLKWRAEEEAARQAAIDAGDPEPEAAEAPEAIGGGTWAWDSHEACAQCKSKTEFKQVDNQALSAIDDALRTEMDEQAMAFDDMGGVLDCADHVEQGFMEQLEAEQAEAEDELKKDVTAVLHGPCCAYRNADLELRKAGLEGFRERLVREALAVDAARAAAAPAATPGNPKAEFNKQKEEAGEACADVPAGSHM